MNATLFAVGLASLSMAACALSGPAPKPSPLKILLQGSSAQDMRQLVLDHGGIVTHDLPIIDAVGARITRKSLDKILLSPLVGRYLDDLSTSGEPDAEPEGEEEKCDVDGALELDIENNEIRWQLYNKKKETARLTRLEIAWPQRMGKLLELKVGTRRLTLSPVSQDQPSNSLVLDYEEQNAPEITTSAPLSAVFSAPGDKGLAASLQQREFSVEAQFAGDCSAKLIPGYANNDENSYYPTVVGADTLHSHGITGKNITVAIIDSGLWEHPALLNDTQGKNRLLARYDAIADATDEEVFDESGHGTHMASVLAHSGRVTHDREPTTSFKGVAPDVNLVAVKAFNIEGQGDFLDIVRAIQYVVDHREIYNIKVLNLSFAARPRWRYWLDPINQAIMRAWASGITVVAAAGNEGPDAMTIGSPGNLPYVITVGAVTDSWTTETRDDDYIPDFSSQGPTPDAHIKPDIVAPGGHMTGLTRPGSTLTREHPEYFLRTGEFVMTGSSQASALVSGIAALLLQLEPDLSPNDIKCKLMTSAEMAINRDGLLTYSPFQQGSGYVSATRAVTLGERGCGNAGLDIQKDINGTEHFQGPAIINDDGSTSLPGLAEMLSTEVPAKGLSDSRKWGVKEHIERQGVTGNAGSDGNDQSPFDWERSYQDERARIERLTEDSPQAPGAAED